MADVPDVNTSAPAPEGSGAPATPAESSPAPAQEPKFAVPHRDSPEYQKWRMTGELPAAKDKPSNREASASSQPSAEAGEEPAEEKTAPGSEPGHQRRNGANDRLQEILSDLKRAGLSPAELKTYRREAQPQAKPPETTVNPPQQAYQPQQSLEPPKLEDFKSWPEFRKAELDYMRNLVRQEFEQERFQEAQRRANQQAAQRLQEARQRYGEDAEASIVSAAQSVFSDQSVHPAIKGLINDSPVIADLLYVMGTGEADFADFIAAAKRNPGEAIRRVVLLEQLVKDELGKQPKANGAEPSAGEEPERDKAGRFLPAKKTTEAPAPTREVSGRASPPADDADAAFARNDVRGYFAAANRRDIAAKQGR